MKYFDYIMNNGITWDIKIVLHVKDVFLFEILGRVKDLNILFDQKLDESDLVCDSKKQKDNFKDTLAKQQFGLLSLL